MAYSKNTIIKAKAVLEKRRNTAKALREERIKEIYNKLPEIKELDNLLAGSTLSQIIEAIPLGSEKAKERISEIQANNLKLQAKRTAILEANGYPADYTDVKYYCQKCEDEGYLLDSSVCECLNREIARIAIADSGIGHLAEAQSFDTFDLGYYSANPSHLSVMKESFDLIKKYADSFNSATKTNLLFIGNTGLGKTHLSTSCAVNIIGKGYEVIYDTAQNILSDFEYERFGRDYNSQQSDSKKTDKYFSCDLLIIDDLGTEMGNNFTVSIIYNLLNTRLNNNKPMIISTNLTSKELRDKYDDRIVSRILGEFEILPFYGNDIRQQKKQF
ncbi:MAG: DNA replication protein DnaC [Ruminococcaceae bacterium]|nr:DNA replication protein DnaC [Oscillospiraceae bacterium]